ncbi:hypothetical protein PSJE_00030 [Pseudomonas jessenii]|nr:hypothetical protein PSJE_00030 [Pseudomonas jessenii]
MPAITLSQEVVATQYNEASISSVTSLEVPAKERALPGKLKDEFNDSLVHHAIQRVAYRHVIKSLTDGRLEAAVDYER